MNSEDVYIDRLSSTRNPKIKNFTLLQKAKERSLQGLFVVEGRKEITRALRSGYRADHLFFCPDIIHREESDEIVHMAGERVSIYAVTCQVYDHIAYRGGVEGVIGWFEIGHIELNHTSLSDNPLILVLESVEKPGNLGAILRTADAAGVDAVIVCDPRTDIYNPNVIRSSLGAVFSNQVVMAETEEVIDFLKNRGINIFCTALTASCPYTDTDFSKPAAIVLGTESTGLSGQWLDAASQNIIIPMKGGVDSMNVSVTAAIVLFEVIRQRNLNV